jgi:hypothetical protein
MLLLQNPQIHVLLIDDKVFIPNNFFSRRLIRLRASFMLPMINPYDSIATTYFRLCMSAKIDDYMHLLIILSTITQKTKDLRFYLSLIILETVLLLS